MAPLVFAFFLSSLSLGRMVQTADSMVSSSVHQDMRFVAARVGDSVTLQCFYKSNIVPYLYWLKQTLGQKPRIISTFYKYTNATFYEEFKNNPRFTLHTENGKNHLTITDLHISDSAIYYCVYNLRTLEFLDGCIVSVKGSGLNIQALVQQSASTTVQPGGSVTLNCTVHTGSCDGEHSVYWFKKEEESHPGIIYSHGNRNDQCEKKPNTQTHTCVYNLPIKSLNQSHVGTYHCAVASCGHILFGNGTTLKFEDETKSLVMVYVLSGALAFATTLVLLLCKTGKRKSFQSDSSQAGFSAPHTEGNQAGDNLHYAALRVIQPTRSRRQKNIDTECVYAMVAR